MSNSNKWRRQSNRVTWLIAFLPLFYLSSCTSPLWWNDPNRGFSYRGWGINIVDQATVMRECATGFQVLGCVKPEAMTAFAVNNPYILWHECEHINNIMDGKGSEERLKDEFFMAFGLNDLLALITGIFPASNDCGDGTMVQWNDGKTRLIQAKYGTIEVLPTIEEWNRLHPEQAMSR
jgi:hypothetical protein